MAGAASTITTTKTAATSESEQEDDDPPNINRKDKCKCDCEEEEEETVQLMAMEKTIRIPKIKIHDFGKKEDWDMYGKMKGIDMSNPYSKGKKKKFVIRGMSTMSEKEAESGWEIAGKYDFKDNKWSTDANLALGI